MMVSLKITEVNVTSYIKLKCGQKKCSDTIYVIIANKFQKYPSTTILRHADVLAKVNKLP